VFGSNTVTNVKTYCTQFLSEILLLSYHLRNRLYSHLQLQRNIHLCSMDSHSLSLEAGEISTYSNRSTRLFVPRSTILSQQLKGGEIAILRSRRTRSSIVPWIAVFNWSLEAGNMPILSPHTSPLVPWTDVLSCPLDT